MKCRRRSRRRIFVRARLNKGVVTMDIVLIAIGVVFFALSLAYVKACDSL
jgi:hypothetical protein